MGQQQNSAAAVDSRFRGNDKKSTPVPSNQSSVIRNS
jgi:hypothetical protein